MTREDNGWAWNGPLLEKLRYSSEKTKMELAAACGVTYSVIRSWELGRNVPDAMRLPVIAQVYGCSIDDLFVPIPK